MAGNVSSSVVLAGLAPPLRAALGAALDARDIRVTARDDAPDIQPWTPDGGPDALVLGPLLDQGTVACLCRRIKLSVGLNRIVVVVLRREGPSPRAAGLSVESDHWTNPADGAQQVADRIQSLLAERRGRLASGLRFEVHLVIGSEMKCLIEVGDMLRELLAAHGVDARDVQKLRFCIAELGLNALEWGNRWRKDKTVRFGFELSGDRFAATIADEGEGFDPSELPYAADAANPIGHVASRRKAGIRFGGYGILVCREFLDELRYSPKGNEVTAVKALRPAEETGSQPQGNAGEGNR
jgi:anti-sigma regulatory factor (Ser/Thr protein kinase)